MSSGRLWFRSAKTTVIFPINPLTLELETTTVEGYGEAAASSLTTTALGLANTACFTGLTVTSMVVEFVSSLVDSRLSTTRIVRVAVPVPAPFGAIHIVLVRPVPVKNTFVPATAFGLEETALSVKRSGDEST